MSFMKSFLLLTIVVTIASADDEVTSTAAVIVSQENTIDAKGNFHWSFESSDGSKSQQEGELKSEGDTTEEVISGSFEYPGEGGNVYKVSYTADSRGFRPQGEHIPSVPPLIQRSLDLLATLPVTTESPASK
ncbi:endocuticle structural glycoprotein SgAbd-3-like [Anoplophora glabripennis]|uniref:endocuticle structural glycoprotein SgAbd-3-like n=1 Tax=Anoplophora glabripennis TaxID=217634 RepID=UPI0008736C00|nr:endocuticle structural glycoprotein SgAbd-3-like [Anoplophora glabripennis]